MEMSNQKVVALKLALKKMFNEKHFSICVIDSCLKMTGCIPDTEVYKIMSAVHCVSFSDMEEDFRNWLFEESIKMFKNNGFNFDKLDILDEQNRTLYLKLS